MDSVAQAIGASVELLAGLGVLYIATWLLKLNVDNARMVIAAFLFYVLCAVSFGLVLLGVYGIATL